MYLFIKVSYTKTLLNFFSFLYDMKKLIIFLLLLFLAACSKTKYVCSDGTTLDNASLCISKDDFSFDAFWKTDCNNLVILTGTADAYYELSEEKDFNLGCKVYIDDEQATVDSLNSVDAFTDHKLKACCSYIYQGFFDSNEYCKEAVLDKLCENQTLEPCSDYLGLNITKICLNSDNDTLDFTLHNYGFIAIEGVKIIATGIDLATETILNAQIPVSGIFNQSINYTISTNGPIIEAGFTPVMTNILCEDNAVLVQDIGFCG